AYIANYPRVPQAHQLLGSAYLSKGDPTRATESYRRFAELAPNDFRGPYMIGLGLEVGGRPAEAARQFEAALAMSPGFADALGKLVAMDLSNNRADAALARVNRQIALVPDSGALYFVLGKTHQARREVAPAEAAFLKAVELEPRLVAAYTELGTLYASRGNFDQALAKLSEALDSNPNNPVVMMLSGMVQQQKGDVPGAIATYEKVLAIHPQTAVAANNLAYLYSEHGGDQEKALELAQQAKELAPEDPSISDTLGWILYKRGLYQRALGYLQESAEKIPNNAEIQYHLGMTLYQLQDRSGAQRALTRALELNPTFSGADEAQKTLAEIG
ncbi:MAG: tetratricopeptide repeat protein, partial [Vicinamibacteria bacterium]